MRLFDLIRACPDQARLALGTRGVIWATAAGAVGLVCCAISMASIAYSLHATETGYARHRTADLLALDQSTRQLMHSVHLMTYGQLQPADAEVALRKAWARRAPPCDRRRSPRDARPARERGQGVRPAEPPARPGDAWQGDRPARAVQRG